MDGVMEELIVDVLYLLFYRRFYGCHAMSCVKI